MADRNGQLTPQVGATDASGADRQPPSGQLPPVDPALFEQASAAVLAIRGRGRRANGQAGAGNTLALRHGLRSAQLLEHPDIAAWHQEQVQAINTDLGGEAELSTLARGSVREAARLEVILAAIGDELLEHGVLTGKGRTRSATMVYLRVFDRYLKVTAVLGLARRTKRVESFTEAVRVGGRA